SYLGTNNGSEAERMIEEGNEYARSVFKAMAYQTAKEIGAMAAVLKGDVDAVAITGGLAYSKYLTDEIKEMVSFIAPVYIIPGENEMLALAESSLRYLKGEEKARDYDEVKL
ncbi:MAG: butyrate kinase, partial [Lachnospiraceae bacterium]|nr:butyrate kinase [Lachnospiraceae bacterium]